MSTALNQRRLLSASIVGAVLYFLVLWLLDFPKPHVDDLFYTGAALNMATGGDFSNPLIAREGFPWHYFYIYPPLESYVLWGWLKLFGVGARSLTGYAAVLNLLTAASVIAVLRKHQAPALLEWLVPLAVSSALLPQGLRAEPLSIALTAAGFAVAECGETGPLRTFLGFLLMATGASAAPRIVAFSFALMICSSLNLLMAGGPQVTRRRRTWIGAGAGVLVAGIFFLLMIHFRLGEFWRAFRWHSDIIVLGKLAVLAYFFHGNPNFNGSQIPLAFILLGLVIFAWPRQPGALARAALFIIVAFPIQAFTRGLGAGACWYVALALLFFSVPVLKNLPEFGTRLNTVMIVAFCLANIEPVCVVYGQLAGHITHEHGNEEAAALAMRPAPDRAVFVDHTVARYIFDYKLPAGLLDFQAGAPFPKPFAFFDVRPGDTYLIGPDSANALKTDTMFDQEVDFWAPFGFNEHRFARHPREVFIVPGDACGGLRAEFKDKPAARP